MAKRSAVMLRVRTHQFFGYDNTILIRFWKGDQDHAQKSVLANR